MNLRFRFGVTSAAALALLVTTACSSEPAAESSIFTEEYYAAHGVRVALETVHEITWERVEDAFNYVITADGVEGGSNVGSRNFVIHDGPFQEVIIDAFSFRGDPRGQAELVSREPAERYVTYGTKPASPILTWAPRPRTVTASPNSFRAWSTTRILFGTSRIAW